MSQETQNQTFSAENTPLVRLYQGVKPLPDVARNLGHAWQVDTDELVILDTLPRHDCVIDDELLAKLTRTHYNHALWVGRNRLSHSIETIKGAIASIEGSFRGEEKVLYLDRLIRHQEEAEALFELFGTLPKPLATKPFEIRQLIAAGLHGQVSSILLQITPLRRSLKGETLPDNFLGELTEIEAIYLRIRADSGRWRDNPSQKLGAKAAKVAEQLTDIAARLARMKNNVQYEAQQIGVPFYNRQGRAFVQRI